MPSLAETIYENALKHPDRTAIVCGDDVLTYNEFASLCRRVAMVLHRRGVDVGDRILLIAENSISFAAVLVATADLGAILVPVSTSLSLAAIVTAGQSVHARHIIADDRVIAALQGEKQIGFGEGACLTLGKLQDQTHPSEGQMSLMEGVSALKAVPEAFGLGHDALSYILTMTSGSTGAPKPILLTQGSKTARASALVALYGVDENDTVLAATPMYHSLAQRLVLTPLLVGGTSVIMGPFTPQNWLESVCSHHVSFTILVSSQIVAISRYIKENSNDDLDECQSLRVLVSSSAALKITDKAEALEVFECDIYECYGTSEIAIATSLKLSADQEVLGSVGFAAPGVGIQILSEEDEVCKSGEIGEIVCRTPMLFGGYYEQEAQTQAAMYGEYFKTGDLGRIDAEGALHFCGRKKDIIIVGGINVYPSDIENVVLQMPGIFACAAFSMESNELGEVTAIAIVRDAMDETALVSARSVRRWCMGRLADFQFPHRIVFVEALPTNAMGKLMRGELSSSYGASTWENTT